MSSNITDLAEWKERHSFLDTVWDPYEEFDKPLENDKYKYEVVCNPFIKLYGEEKEEHKTFCMKLVRNLGCYATDSIYFHPKTERCNILYYWIYNSVKNKNISNNLITACFDDYITHMKQMSQSPKCYYYPYENIYNDPLKMIILEIFQYNMKDIKEIVALENKAPDYRVQKYICECVKLYKEMNRENCAHSNPESAKSIKTCEKLNTFKETYEYYLSTTPYKNYNIPSLDKGEDDYLTMCQPDAPKLLLREELDGKVSVLQPETQERDDKKEEFSPPSLSSDENKGSSISRTVSTTFGTVAGASSILALLYKFTPGRNWMRSGFRGGRGRIGNNLYSEHPNELFYDGFEGEVMSSHNPTYNVGYGSA